MNLPAIPVVFVPPYLCFLTQLTDFLLLPEALPLDSPNLPAPILGLTAWSQHRLVECLSSQWAVLAASFVARPAKGLAQGRCSGKKGGRERIKEGNGHLREGTPRTWLGRGLPPMKLMD